MSRSTNNACLPEVQDIHALRKLRIYHTRIRQLIADARALIFHGSQQSILMVVGPTGVGKSTLAKFLVEDATHKTPSDSGVIQIPALYIEVRLSGERVFQWKTLYQQILQAIAEKVGLASDGSGIDQMITSVNGNAFGTRRSLTSLRTAVERALHKHGVQFVVLDESSHMFTERNKDVLKRQLDTLKSLANQCGSQFVMVGAYDLFELLNLSAQVARRTHVLHFERYREDRPEDVLAFANCIQTFQNHDTNLWNGIDLTEYTKALIRNTVGCVGTLSSVLIRAGILALADGGGSEKALERALLSDEQQRGILKETIDGEELINPGLSRELERTARKKIKGDI